MKTLDFFKLLYLIFVRSEPDLVQIQRYGLLAVKIGQILALRPDFLGAERCRLLAQLYSHAESLPAEDAKVLLTRCGGAQYLDHFSQFELEPFASASIGQVHRARLRSGEEVAVKLVKQDCAESFREDVGRLRNLFRWAIRFYPRLHGVANPTTLLEQIERMTSRELDLRHEVEGGDRLEGITQQHRARYDLSRLGFRTIYTEYSNKDLLVSEYLHGPTLDTLLSSGKLDYQSLLDLFKIHGYFLFAVGTFHGDLHPGNIVLQNGQFYFLDMAYIGHAPDHMRRGLFHFFAALSMDDYSEAAGILNRMATVPLEGRRYLEFRKKFLALYADFAGKTVSEVSLTRKMMQTIRMGVEAGLDFDEGMFDIIRSLMFLDGMVLRAHPNAVLLRDMRKLIADFDSYVS